jgi:hypothetical protein
MTKYGFDDAAWESAKAEGKELLAAYAKRRQMIPYSEFVARINSLTLEPHDPRLRFLLGEISSEESRAGRGMLTALVVHKTGDMQPGPGFFELAKQLGHDTSDIVKFWIEEVKLVFRHWSGEDGAA